MAKVSIIIPAYNTANLIKNCLDSVFAQTFSEFETLVVNDGSPDTPELEAVLAPYLDRITYIRQENKRAAGARNTAIARANGDFLAFLDSDDSWFPHHLASQMKQFDENPSLDLAYANGVRIANPKRVVKFMDACPSHGRADFEALVVERCQIPISTAVIRKQALLAAGGFDETLPRCDDYDLWLRVAFQGAEIGYRRDVQARLNGGRPDSLGESSLKMAEAYLNILQKASRTLPLNKQQHQLVHDRMAEIRSRYLIEQGKWELGEGRFAEAKELFSEANKSVRQLKVSLALFGLSIAPATTSKIIFAWQRALHSGSWL